MAKSSRSKLGKKAGQTRNQRRKAEYAKMREEQSGGRVGKRRRSRSTDPRAGIHYRPCGNPACRECYAHVVGYGIVQRSTATFASRLAAGEISEH